MKQSRNKPKEPKLFSLALKFYEAMYAFARIAYRGVVRPKPAEVAPEEARRNMEGLVKKIKEYDGRPEFLMRFALDDESTEDEGLVEAVHKILSDTIAGIEKVKPRREKKTVRERLESFGESYVPWKTVSRVSEARLWQLALEYDLKGIIPTPNEGLRDFVYRANTLLFIHKGMKRTALEPKLDVNKENLDITVRLEPGKTWYSGSLNTKVLPTASQEDIDEAVKRIPHFMDLRWVCVYVKDKSDFIAPALGLTFTLPKYNGFNFVQVLSEYKSREQYLSVLAHELTHAGTVHLDTNKKYVETKAYAVGKGDAMLGEYAVAINAIPNPIMSVLKFIAQNYLYLPFPDKTFKWLLPKIAGAVRVRDNTNTYREVERRLQPLYGDKTSYVLGRLNADEMEEIRDTNDPAERLALKDGLKWRIMKENVRRLEERAA